MRHLVVLPSAVIVFVLLAAPSFAQDKAAAGQKVFAREKCAMCHTAAKNSLEGVGTKLTAEQIREWVENPKAAMQKAGGRGMMPAKTLSKDDVDNLVAYLQTKKK